MYNNLNLVFYGENMNGGGTFSTGPEPQALSPIQLSLTQDMRTVFGDKLPPFIIEDNGEGYQLVGKKWTREELYTFIHSGNFSGVCSIKQTTTSGIIGNITFPDYETATRYREQIRSSSELIPLNDGQGMYSSVKEIKGNSTTIKDIISLLPEKEVGGDEDMLFTLTYELPVKNPEIPTPIIEAGNDTRADIGNTLSWGEKIGYSLGQFYAKPINFLLHETRKAHNEIGNGAEKPGNVVQMKFGNQEKNITAEDYKAGIQRLEKLLELLPQDTSLFSAPSLMNARGKGAIKGILEEYFRNDVDWNNYTAKIGEPNIEKAEQIESLRNIIEFIQETARKLKDIQNIDITNTSQCKAIREALKIPYMTRVDGFNEWLDKVARKFPFPKNTHAPDIQDVLGSPQVSVSLAAE